MRIRNRTECGLANRTAVQLQSNRARERGVVLAGQFHEEIVGVLAVVDLFTPALLTARKEIGIPAPANRPRLGTHHPAKHQTAAAERSLGHAHDPVDAADLTVDALA